jgi:hypothetical protein
MNRKRFLIISGIVAGGAAAPWLFRWDGLRPPPPLTPWYLAHIFDHARLQQLGQAYLAATPTERSAPELTRLLLPGESVAGLDDDTLRGRLRNRVLDDFTAGRVTLVDGWILSLTEARQCALLALARS